LVKTRQYKVEAMHYADKRFSIPPATKAQSGQWPGRIRNTATS
jgi:hypothetical protein